MRSERARDKWSDKPDHQPTQLEISDRRRRRIGSVASKLILGGYLTSLPLQVIQTDIAINKMELESSTPTIHSILESNNPDNSDKATIFIDGFASQNGSWTTSKIADTIQIINDSNIWALEYAGSGISVPAITEQIFKKVEEEGVTSVSLYGYSIGGMIALEAAGELIEDYGVDVTTIFLDHSPADEESIRQSMRDQASPAIDTISWFHSVGIDIEYSNIARDAAGMLFKDTVSLLGDTPFSLMRDQYLYGIESDTDQSIQHLGEISNNLNITYITSLDPESDTAVDVARSEQMFEEMSGEHDGISFFSIAVDGAIHSRLDLTVDQYAEAFANAAPLLEEQLVNPEDYPTV